MARSKKLKKALKALGAGIAIAGLGRAFANRNKTSAADVDSGKGGDSSSAIARRIANEPAVQAPVYQDDIMRGGSGVKNMRNIPGIVVPGKRYSMLDSMGFKKGGRVGCGIAKRGFGKAMKKGKK
tara:strand:- start:134 stop:508 length:375 start_codon:yes stop_codon:yes gene_type:complete